MMSDPLGTAAASAYLAASPAAMHAEAGLLESSALWDMAYGGRALRGAADLSSGSSGYQSGTSHTGRIITHCVLWGSVSGLTWPS